MNVCTLFWSLFPTVDSNTFPLHWQLIAPKKAVKCSLFSAMDHVCTHIDGIAYRYTQKSVHKWSKKAKMGGRGGRQGGMGQAWMGGLGKTMLVSI